MNETETLAVRPVISAFGSARDPGSMQDLSRRIASAGFDTLWIPEGSQPVFSICTAAALAAPDMGLGTSVAVAFPRSPMLTAQAAWMLAQVTGGRFKVGLGTQVRAHIERRYSAAFAHPGSRIREYVQAMRAIYRAFRREETLSYHGDYYNFSLLPDMWSPGPMQYDDPPIYLAGVRSQMSRIIGECADGMLVHPLSSVAYLDEIVLPAVADGERKASRAPGSVRLICPVMTAVSDDEAVISQQREKIRARLAFYGSTPGYGVVFDASGWPGVGERLNALQREGDFAAMSKTITDEMVDSLAITSTWDALPQRLLDRYGDRADEIVCYSVIEQWNDDADSLGRWQDVTRRFQQLTGVAT
jgi:probable F420-dependent oxidoreductase